MTTSDLLQGLNPRPFQLTLGMAVLLLLARVTAPRFFCRHLWALDHKRIARHFLATSVLFGLLGGILALGVRWQLAWPGSPVPLLGGLFGWKDGVMPPEGYNVVFTMHASVMVFLVVIPLLMGGLATFCVPLMIGARNSALPHVSAAAFWTLIPAFVFMMASFLVPEAGEGAATGWTAYPPVSEATTGQGQSFWCLGVLFAGVSSMLSALSAATTIVTMRCPGLTYFRLPLTVWSILVTSVLVLLATPVLGAATLMLLCDRVLETSFFVASGQVLSGVGQGTGGGQPILWQHLFWFYSHPAVYVMALPTMGIVSDLLAHGARKPVFGYTPMVWSLAAIAGLGFLVWGHHMFQAGMNPRLGQTFMLATMMIATPSAVKTFNWLATLHRGKLSFRPQTLYALAFVSMWVIGGLSGIFMAATPVDVVLHDTYAVVAHFHYIVFGATLFGVFGALFHWFPKLYGRTMSARWAKIHFWVSFLSFNGAFFPMHVLGSRGMLRRTADPYYYPDLQGMLPMNQFMSFCAMVLGAAQLVFVLNLVLSRFRGRRVTERNPWGATTLEWAAPSPALPGQNFDHPPRARRGPYEYGDVGSSLDHWPQFDAPDSAPAPDAPSSGPDAPKSPSA